jgi:hypothetical protein
MAHSRMTNPTLRRALSSPPTPTSAASPHLKTSAGKDPFTELVRQVDVVVENFSPRAAELGFTYETLSN